MKIKQLTPVTFEYNLYIIHFKSIVGHGDTKLDRSNNKTF